ncbi:energy transducer TonB [Pendulispora brunnea]|uniref:Energy transducer TonB n=1 Tax=Pendulispora brunnea TaxID=2905690 RepID=A0ABZ2K628_9BACT
MATLPSEGGPADASPLVAFDTLDAGPEPEPPREEKRDAQTEPADAGRKRPTATRQSPGWQIGQVDPKRKCLITFGCPGMKSPTRLSSVAPQYPKEAIDKGIEGLVLLKCLLTKTGHVTNCNIIRDQPGLGIAAREAVTTWIYEPVRSNGIPQDIWYTFVFRFSLYGCPPKPGSSPQPPHPKGPPAEGCEEEPPSPLRPGELPRCPCFDD